MPINSISDLRRIIRNGPYAWPGGYPLYFITDDGGVLSFKAVKQELRSVLEAIRDHSSNGWRVVAANINWEDNDLICDHTNERIGAAS